MSKEQPEQETTQNSSDFHDRVVSYLTDRDVARSLLETTSSISPIMWKSLKTLDMHTRTEVPVTKGRGQYKKTLGYIDIVLQARFEYSIPEFKLERTVVQDPEECPHKCRKCMLSYPRTERTTVTNVSGEFLSCEEGNCVQSGAYEGKMTTLPLYIEVKTGRGDGFGSILRQCNKYYEYREFVSCFPRLYSDEDEGKICLATTFDLTHGEHEQLKSANIVWLRVDVSNMEQWEKENKQPKPDMTL